MRLAGLRDGRCQDVSWVWGKGKNSFWVKPKPYAWPSIRELCVGALGIWFFDFHFSSSKYLSWDLWVGEMSVPMQEFESFGLIACLSFPSGPLYTVVGFWTAGTCPQPLPWPGSEAGRQNTKNTKVLLRLVFWSDSKSCWSLQQWWSHWVHRFWPRVPIS